MPYDRNGNYDTEVISDTVKIHSYWPGITNVKKFFKSMMNEFSQPFPMIFSLVFLSTICLSVIAERSIIIIQIKLKLYKI